MADSPNISRYHRQIILPELGTAGQEKIARARVLVVGAGALGAAALLYLVPAGVGKVGILDYDEVNLTNLHRQVLYTMDNVGQPKALAARDRLHAMNPDVNLEIHFLRLHRQNALEIIGHYDMVLDCSDNFPTKFLVNDACVILNKPCAIGAAMGFAGQLSVYNYLGGPTYRCLIPEPPDPLTLPTCANAGVMGMVPGIIGNLMALEAVKVCAGVGEVLSGRLLHFDGLQNNFVEVPIELNTDNLKIQQLTDYEYTCPDKLLAEHTIEPTDFFSTLARDPQWEVIALSDDQEYLQAGKYRWKTIPLYQMPDAVNKIPSQKKIMLVCENGIKNFDALKFLLVKKNDHRAYALNHGLSALSILGIDE